MLLLIEAISGILLNDRAAQAQPSTEAAKAASLNPLDAVPPDKARAVRAVRFASPPVIDGNLDEAVWQQATILKDFYQTQPGDNVAPSYPTLAMLGYDDKFFYLGIRALDDPGKIRATVAKRDAVTNDDYVAIYLDTFNFYWYRDFLRLFEEEFGPQRTATRPGAFAGAAERSTVSGFTLDSP
jgi:hypothetical protein